MNPSNLACVGHAYGASDLALAQVMFDAHDIPLLPTIPYSNTLLAQYGLAFGGVRLMVPEKHASEALALMSGTAPFVRHRAPVWALAIMLLGLLMAYAPPPATGFFPRRPSEPQIATT